MRRPRLRARLPSDHSLGLAIAGKAAARLVPAAASRSIASQLDRSKTTCRLFYLRPFPPFEGRNWAERQFWQKGAQPMQGTPDEPRRAQPQAPGFAITPRRHL